MGEIGPHVVLGDEAGITRVFVDFAVHSHDLEIDSVLEMLQKSILDYIGLVSFAAHNVESSSIFIKAIEALSAPRFAPVIGHHSTLQAQYAALLNGTLAHTMDCDDTHIGSALHPGAPVVSATLAPSSVEGASGRLISGRLFFEALAVGYEIMCRLGNAVSATLHRVGFHPTAVLGVYGAAAAAGRIASLSIAEMEALFGIVGSMASGSMQYLDNGAWNKRLHPGLAAHNALLAVQLARTGMLGATRSIEGSFGLLSAYGRASRVDLAIVEDLDLVWESAKTAIKPYASCRLTHAAIDAVYQLRERAGSGIDLDIHVEVVFSGKSFMIVGHPASNKIRPTNTVEAQFSVYYHVAVAWLHGHNDWTCYRYLGADDVLRLSQRIKVRVDDGIPDESLKTTVRIGHESVTVDQPRGEIEKPVTREAVQIEDLKKQVEDFASAIKQSRGNGFLAQQSSINFERTDPSHLYPESSTATVDGPAVYPYSGLAVLNNTISQSQLPLVSHNPGAHHPPPPLPPTATYGLPHTNHCASGLPPFRPPAAHIRRLGNVSLEEAEIDILFITYFTHYHPFLCFLEAASSPDEYFDRSPLLFWAVVAVASRRYDQNVTLLRSLSSLVTQLVWKTLSETPASVYTVQALLLLCTWPFPAPSLWQEPTPTWCAIAVSMAQQLGLPRFDGAGEFTRVKQPLNLGLQDERLRTWAACVIVTHNTNASFGLAQSHLAGLTLLSGEEHDHVQSLSQPLQQQIQISRFCSRVSNDFCELTMGDKDGVSHPTASEILNTLETDLIVLETTLRGTADVTDLYLTSAKLFLYMHCFYLSPTATTKKHGIMTAFTLAQNLIAQCSELDQRQGVFEYIPLQGFRMLFTAACIIWKVVHSSYGIDTDLTSGRASFNRAVAALRKCSVENNDNAGRQSEILVQLWKGTEDDGEKNMLNFQEPTVACRSRYSASLAFDSLFYWRDRVGGQSANGLHTSATLPVDGARLTSTVSPSSSANGSDAQLVDAPGLGANNMTSELWNFGTPPELMYQISSF